MDMLEQAKTHYDEANGNGYTHDALVGQLAALIAQVEADEQRNKYLAAIVERLDKLIKPQLNVGTVTVKSEHGGKSVYVTTSHLVEDDTIVRPASDE